MLKKDIYILKIDENFKHLIPPLSAEERKQLEKNIIQDGCRDALIVWGETIIDGHNRYEICSRQKIPFAIEKANLSSREEAVAWICANQLGRRNISDETRRYLIGKRYMMEKMISVNRNTSGLNQHTQKEVSCQNDNRPDLPETVTRERLGKDYRVSPTTIVRYGAYASALDIIAKAIPELHEKIMSGELKVTQNSVMDIARLKSSEIRDIGKDIMDNPNAYIGYTDKQGALRRNTSNKALLAQMQIGAIKETPKYDPDAEIQSLGFTIPSWISSINRVQMTTKFSEVSDKASEKIMETLDDLKVAIDTICFAIQRRKQ